MPTATEFNPESPLEMGDTGTGRWPTMEPDRWVLRTTKKRTTTLALFLLHVTVARLRPVGCCDALSNRVVLLRDTLVRPSSSRSVYPYTEKL